MGCTGTGMNRRSFLRGLLAAPAVITTRGLLMPVRALLHPDDIIMEYGGMTWADGRIITYDTGWSVMPRSLLSGDPNLGHGYEAEGRDLLIGKVK